MQMIPGKKKLKQRQLNTPPWSRPSLGLCLGQTLPARPGSAARDGPGPAPSGQHTTANEGDTDTPVGPRGNGQLPGNSAAVTPERAAAGTCASASEKLPGHQDLPATGMAPSGVTGVSEQGLSLT